MLSLREIEKYYPENEKGFKKNILREYLQYKILEFIFDSKFGNKLSFLGGTALRIVHGNIRFSEDLDFDNFGLEKEEFEAVSEIVKKKLELEGCQAEIRNVYKGAFRCNLRIPKILFDSGLSGYEEEKILIQLDTAPHSFHYKPEKVILGKFDIFTRINTTPLDIILSQKIFAIFNRKRLKGRDFFDAIFLFGRTKPNYQYLQLKLNIKNGKELKKRLLAFSKKVDFREMADDVRQFLVNPDESKRLILFSKYIESLEM